MSSSPIAQALKEIAEQKGLDFEVVLGTLEAALAAAFRKDFGEKNQNIVVEFDPETGAMKAFDVKTVVEDQELPAEGEEPIEYPDEPELDANGDPIKRFNPKTDIMLKDILLVKKDAELGDIISTELPIPSEFGRMAAQTAKQVITQKLREAERNSVYDEFRDKQGTIMIGSIGRREARHILIDVGRATGVFPVEEQVPTENYRTGMRMKFFVMSVAMTTKGPEIILSRAHPELVREVFENEIPEIATGTVKIKAIAREAGSRAKVAVATDDSSIDPVGSCIGQRGTRIQTIIAELGGEKIDLIVWSKEPREFVTAALAPAKVSSIEFIDAEHVALVTVPSDQLSLAIGRGGQNVRLAARLTGWKINVRDDGSGEAQKEEVVEPVTESVIEAQTEVPAEPIEEPTITPSIEDVVQESSTETPEDTTK